MRIFKTVLFLIFLIVFQMVVLSRISIFGINVDLPVAFVVLLSFFKGPRDGFWYGAFLGFMMDIFSSIPFVFVVSIPIVCLVCGMLKDKLFKEDEAVMFVFVFAGTFLVYLASSIVFSRFYGVNSSDLWLSCFGVSILNTLFVPVLKMSLYKIEGLSDE